MRYFRGNDKGRSSDFSLANLKLSPPKIGDYHASDDAGAHGEAGVDSI